MRLTPSHGARRRVDSSAVVLAVAALVVMTLAGWRPSPALAAFPDVPLSDPAYTAVTGLAAKRALDGFDDGTFRPLSLMSRSEFAKVVTGAVCRNLEAPRALPFRDVASVPGTAPGLLQGTARAFAAGLMRGTTASTFSPDNPVRLAQALTVLVRAGRAYVPGGLDPLAPGYDGAFSDFSDPQHGDNARVAALNGLIPDAGLASADPWIPLTRAQAAELVWALVIEFG